MTGPRGGRKGADERAYGVRVTEDAPAFTVLVQAVRDADAAHKKEGGGTRHWVRDFFLPALADHELAVIDIARHVSHGRHCSCSSCAQEDWTRIAAPCGMHGVDCPSVYAPLGVAGERLRPSAPSGDKR